MNDNLTIKQKILLELFVTPSTMIPSLAGITMMLGGWSFDSSTIMFLGFLGLLSSCGIGVWRLIFNLNDIANDFAEKTNNKESLMEEAALDALDKKLTKNKDPRDQKYLRKLRKVYNHFEEDFKNDKLGKYVTEKTAQDIGNMFKNYVSLLEQSVIIWEHSRTMDGKIKKKYLNEEKKFLQQ